MGNRKGRKPGTRLRHQVVLYPILESLYLAGYSTWAAWRIVREQGHTCSRQTVWKRWQEFKVKHPEALLQYGRKGKS